MGKGAQYPIDQAQLKLKIHGEGGGEEPASCISVDVRIPLQIGKIPLDTIES